MVYRQSKKRRSVEKCRVLIMGPNGTNTDECGSNRANEHSPRDEVSEDSKQRDEYYEKLAEKDDSSEDIRAVKRIGRVAVDATELSLREHATQDELFPESWVTGQ